MGCALTKGTTGSCPEGEVRQGWPNCSCVKTYVAPPAQYDGTWQKNSCTSSMGDQDPMYWTWNQDTSATTAAACKAACGSDCSAYLFNSTSSTCIKADAACDSSDETAFSGQVKRALPLASSS